MRNVVNTSGTGWPSAKGAGGPRVDSGDMLRDIDYDKVALGGTTKSGKRRLRARFGWIKNRQDYYRYQDEGFANLLKREENRGVTWNTGSAGYTVGMNAVQTGYLVAREYLIANLGRVTRKAWQKKGKR